MRESALIFFEESPNFSVNLPIFQCCRCYIGFFKTLCVWCKWWGRSDLNTQPAGITSSRTKSSPEESAYPFRASGARRNTGLYYDPNQLFTSTNQYLTIQYRTNRR